MLKHKRLRQKGKVSLTKYFGKFNDGDSVALVKDLAVQSPSFPNRMQGRTGKVARKRGSAYVVEVNDYNMKKTFIVRPVHVNPGQL